MYLCAWVQELWVGSGIKGDANVLSVHVWVVGGRHGSVIRPQMDCLSVGLLCLTVSILDSHDIHLC